MKWLPRVIATAMMVGIVAGAATYLMAPRATSFPLPGPNVKVSLPSESPYRELTSGSWSDMWPAWSPNGSLIAYVSSRSGMDALYVMNSSGGNSNQVSAGSEVVSYPAWNPNSTEIAYWAMNGQASEICIYSLSDNSTYVVPGSSPFAAQARATWSPDGLGLAYFVYSDPPELMVFEAKTGSSSGVASANGLGIGVTWASSDELVYSTTMGGDEQILELNLSSGASVPLLTGEANFTSPAAGPNGTIAYYSDLDTGSDSIYYEGCSMYYSGYSGFNVWVANPDGSNPTFQYVNGAEGTGGSTSTQVPYIPGVIDVTYQPTWSPDGNIIVYTAQSAGTGFSLFVWDVATWTSTQIGPLASGVNSVQPTWSPSGLSIAFSSNLDGFYHIWVLNISGNLTSSSTGY